MNENEYIANIICEQLTNGLPIVLASIVQLQGSSPRHHGTKMVVGTDGKSYGTIGGSLLEATTLKEAMGVLLQRQSKLMNFDLIGNGVYAKGMICGGKAVVLLDYIPAAQENFELFKCWHDTMASGRDFYFLTHLRGTNNTVDIAGRSLLFSGGNVIGNYPIPSSHVEIIRAELHNISKTTIIPIEDIRVVVDPIRKLKTLYCFGAGHVAVPTAHIAAMAGFRVVVLDDRSEFANAERFPDANHIRLIANFNQAFAGLDIDSDSFIVILTRGHQFDREVLEESLKTNAGYIGMISSRKKRDAVYAALIAKGLNIQELKRVYSPIGIAIGGETPEEIAVSIVAELIYERSRQQK